MTENTPMPFEADDNSSFDVGPEESVTDSRDLPAVTPEEEKAAVSSTTKDEIHPDARDASTPKDPTETLPEDDGGDDSPLPVEADLDDVIKDVDTDDISEPFDEHATDAAFDGENTDIAGEEK